MTQSNPAHSVSAGVGPTPLSFFLHTLVAMIAGPIASVVLLVAAIFLFNNSSRINSIVNAGGALNPFQWGPGLVLGLLVNWFVQRRTACWVWLVGIAWMAFGVL